MRNHGIVVLTPEETTASMGCLRPSIFLRSRLILALGGEAMTNSAISFVRSVSASHYQSRWHLRIANHGASDKRRRRQLTNAAQMRATASR
jgi:hypothetical protein